MRPEARNAARAQAIKEGKEKRTAAQSAKKAEKAKTAANQAKGGATGRYVLSTPHTGLTSFANVEYSVVGKQAAKGAAPKVKATTR